MSGERAGQARIGGMSLTIWRRHTEKCPNRAKGRAYLKCNCPLWADGYVNGARTLRQSLETRDLARARKKAAALEDPDAPVLKPLGDAVKSFMDQCAHLADSTRGKYQNALTTSNVTATPKMKTM